VGVKHITVAHLVDAASIESRIDRQSIIGHNKFKHISKVRQGIYLLARENLGLSFERIGFRLGRDHSTITYGCKIAAAYRETDPQFRAFLIRVMERAASLERAVPLAALRTRTERRAETIRVNAAARAMAMRGQSNIAIACKLGITPQRAARLASLGQ
jgi:hypothetical protein